MKTIKLQPQELENGTLPYPYFIDKKSKIGRQDFWKGKPSILLGFNSTPTSGDIILFLKDFLKKPKLAIDHIGGGGKEHRRQLGYTNIYNWLKKNNYPKGFRVLCHNCNSALGFYGYCPHQK